MTIGNPWAHLNRKIINCRECPRLVAWREAIARKRRRAFIDWEYWGKPVTGFGDTNAQVLVVGLAPGAHGANRTGRMFTGDGSGEFLYQALFKAGFSNQPNASRLNDGLMLYDLYISAVCRCAPPSNKPTQEEIRNCIKYLRSEIALLENLCVLVALGRIAFEGLRFVLKLPKLEFRHGAVYSLGNGLPNLVASYHPSRQNTQTGRLKKEMFAEIWDIVKTFL